MEIIDVIIATIERIGFIITIIKFIRKWKKQSVCMGLVVFAIVMGGLWYWGYSTNVLLGFAMGIVFCVGGIILVAKIYHNKQLTKQLKQKDREYQIYKKIVEEGEQRLFQKTQEISQEWIEQWNEGVRQWERNVLGIKNPRAGIKVSGNRPSLVKGMCVQGQEKVYSLYEKELKNICAHGKRELCLLYKEALKEDLIEKHYEEIFHIFVNSSFKKYFAKTVWLMLKNGISLQKFVDPVTKKTRYKHTMLSLHWCLYVVDDMITAEYERYREKPSKKKTENQKNIDTLWDNISILTTEYEEISEILNHSNSLSDQYALLLQCKKDVLSLLYDISSDYKTARKTFIYYKKLIKTVKQGYLAFDKSCDFNTVKNAINICRENDKKRGNDLFIVEELRTFEKAYASGAKEWLRLSNEKCDDRLIFWEKLVGISNSQKKLKIIFGEKQLKKLEEAVENDREQVKREMQEAIFENKHFCYYRSRAQFIGCLQDN
ncbi:hypothetical protein MNL06_06950 [Bartonella krasnovii]|uniref:hypothetical protein n=1 Tax=Bartonella krasnovii TaxID=2267275 RepID=UPI001F4D04E0|nr:hypothetical protein [Bartonella krasnovii]UNF45269.1 hypothetical protein MNL06_06950 [Bartonella krasnovii]